MNEFGDNDRGWYGVRAIFRVLNRPEMIYEERVTIWQAASLEDAIAMAENEAMTYADPAQGIIEYLGFAQAFRTYIPNRPPKSGDEVFSLLRGSRLAPAKYLDRFFDTGQERERVISEKGIS
jgi:hypothetical protein